MSEQLTLFDDFAYRKHINIRTRVGGVDSLDELINQIEHLSVELREKRGLHWTLEFVDFPWYEIVSPDIQHLYKENYDV